MELACGVLRSRTHRRAYVLEGARGDRREVFNVQAFACDDRVVSGEQGRTVGPAGHRFDHIGGSADQRVNGDDVEQRFGTGFIDDREQVHDGAPMENQHVVFDKGDQRRRAGFSDDQRGGAVVLEEVGGAAIDVDLIEVVEAHFGAAEQIGTRQGCGRGHCGNGERSGSGRLMQMFHFGLFRL